MTTAFSWEIDFNDDDFATAADVTLDVQNYRLRIALDTEQDEAEFVDIAATGRLLLTNKSRNYSPDSLTSPYADALRAPHACRRVGRFTVDGPTPAGDTVTVDLTGVSEFTSFIRWDDNVSLGTTFAADGTEQTLTSVRLYDGSPSGQVFISIIGTNNRFTPEFEATGRIIFEASDGETVEVMLADADMSEPYQWVPSNSSEVADFAAHVRGLSDQSATLTLTDVEAANLEAAVTHTEVLWEGVAHAPTLTGLTGVEFAEFDLRGALSERYDDEYVVVQPGVRTLDDIATDLRTFAGHTPSTLAQNDNTRGRPQCSGDTGYRPRETAFAPFS